jgi:hypothetical protein
MSSTRDENANDWLASNYLMVVAASQSEATQIGKKLQPESLEANSAKGGFTDSILSRSIESFLWQKTS